MVIAHTPRTLLKTDQLLHQRFSYVSSLWSVESACFIADGGRLRLHTPTQEFQNWVETLRNDHQAYGLTERRLREIYKCEVRAYPSKIKALEQKSSYFGKWQNEVAERLQGKKTASMGKYGTPATKIMEIRREEKNRRSSKRTRS